MKIEKEIALGLKFCNILHYEQKPRHTTWTPKWPLTLATTEIQHSLTWIEELLPRKWEHKIWWEELIKEDFPKLIIASLITCMSSSLYMFDTSRTKIHWNLNDYILILEIPNELNPKQRKSHINFSYWWIL
jgi:hypothetical protein